MMNVDLYAQARFTRSELLEDRIASNGRMPVDPIWPRESTGLGRLWLWICHGFRA